MRRISNEKAVNLVTFNQNTRSVRSRKKKTLFYGPDLPNFSNLRDFFFSLLKLSNFSCFWPKSKKIWLKFLKITENIFTKFFSKICQIFCGDFVFFRGFIFETRKEKKNHLKKCPDRLTLLGRSVRPWNGLFFFRGLMYPLAQLVSPWNMNLSVANLFSLCKQTWFCSYFCYHSLHLCELYLKGILPDVE